MNDFDDEGGLRRSFATRVPGKWVLAGEHAVLRGSPAVALPHPEFALSLRFEPSQSPGLSILPANADGVIRKMLMACFSRSVPAIGGTLTLESTIPVGAGLGSSGALCVAVTRWIAPTLGLTAVHWTDFATRLEDLFHGKSSGMDVAAVSAEAPVLFYRGQGAVPLGVRKLPQFTFHDTGLRARTSDCIAQVDRLAQDQPDLARATDQIMSHAAQLGSEGLRLYDLDGQGLRQIAEAMNQSRQCFDTWGLNPPEAQSLSKELLAQGALATKLTGAGGGGFVVALWR